MYTVAFMFALLLMGLMRVSCQQHPCLNPWRSCWQCTRRLKRKYTVRVRAGGVHALHMLRRASAERSPQARRRVSHCKPPWHPPLSLAPFCTCTVHTTTRDFLPAEAHHAVHTRGEGRVVKRNAIVRVILCHAVVVDAVIVVARGRRWAGQLCSALSEARLSIRQHRRLRTRRRRAYHMLEAGGASADRRRGERDKRRALRVQRRRR
jgi:hypothetical protein